MKNGRNISYPTEKRHVAGRIVRRPFWVPASNYYVLTVAVAIAFFFLTWGILRDEDEDAPWIPSGIGASIVLGGAVILRGVLLRRARETPVRVDQLNHRSGRAPATGLVLGTFRTARLPFR